MANPMLNEHDPRASIEARDKLQAIIRSLVPPANYKVVLDVDHHTEQLVLRVLKRQAVVGKAGRFTLWRRIPKWNHPECEQRRIVARTYDALLTQLYDRPEFLEFEWVVEGALEPRVVQVF